MANNFDSNITNKVARVFLDHFETSRVITKQVDTQLFSGDNSFTPQFGDTISVKRPTGFVTIRTPDGDISAEQPSPIIAGKASATVQNYFTVYLEYRQVDQALKMDQLDELLKPKAKRIVTDLETDFADFMMKNTALIAGSPDTPVSTWDNVAQAGAVMQATGIPMNEDWTYVINPFTQRALASDQRSLGAGGVAGGIIRSAHERATLTDDFAGMRVMSSNSLSSYTAGAGADRIGALAATPDATYLTAKDTMTQQLAVQDFQPNMTIRAGEQIQVQTRSRLDLATRKVIIDETGATYPWTATVTQDVVLDGAGAGTLVVTGPAIFGTDENAGYNTVDSALTSGDVVALLSPASTTAQPNLFFHRQAFTMASVNLPKLYATDTQMETEDGIAMRVSMDSSILQAKQIMRIDLLPAYGVMNPFFAGQGFGGALT